MGAVMGKVVQMGLKEKQGKERQAHGNINVPVVGTAFGQRKRFVYFVWIVMSSI